MDDATGEQRRGGTLGVALAGLAAIAVVAAMAAVVLMRPWTIEGDPVIRVPETDPPPLAVLAAVGVEAPELTAAQVHTAIDDLLASRDLGERVSASVVDLATGTELYQRDAGTAVVPASTIKLVTGAAALASLGPAHRFPTTAVAGTEPGEVVLVGSGDPTLALDGDGFYPDAARLDLLATQVLSALGDTPVSKVTVDATRFTGGVHGPWSSDIPSSGFVGPITALMTDGGRIDPDPAQGTRAAGRWETPELAAGRAFAALLGLGEDAEVTRGEAPPPPDGVVLGEVSSPPLLRLVEIMLSSSDNVVAEVLARQVALARGEPATFAGAAEAVTGVLVDELGLPVDSEVVADGSGLSRDNRISARLLTELLVMAAGPERPRLGGLFAGLPVAGWSGTLVDRHETPPPQTEPGLGVVRAKTGSLNGVDTLAGVVITADGRLLGFAVLADRVDVDHSAARAALDRIPAALATL